MPLLRSREIPPLPTPSSSSRKTLELGFIQPSTPSKNTELMGNPVTPSPNSTDFDANSTPDSGTTVRRSLRLASKSNSDNSPRNFSPGSSSKRRRRNETVVERSHDVEIKDVNDSVEEDTSVRVSDSLKKMNTASSDFKEEKEELKENNLCSSLSPGTKLEKEVSGEIENDVRKKKGKGILIEENDGENERKLEMEEDDSTVIGNDVEMKSSRRRKFTLEEKGKGIVSDFDSSLGDIDLNLGLRFGFDLNGEEDEVEFSDNPHIEEIEEDNEIEARDFPDIGEIEEVNEVDEIGAYVAAEWRMKQMREQYKKTAKRNAAKFAHYNAAAEEKEKNQRDSEDEEELPQEEAAGDADWPGPFSTAMKIIRDREKGLNAQAQNSSSAKGEFPLVSWVPKKERNPELWKKDAPSLQILCLDILSKNVDQISSLYCVPDALRNRLTRLLCDSRKMNPHFLNLLLDGVPSEIRLSDCSWLEERVFEESFERCDTSNLAVLQLDLSGHCVSDSSLNKALVSKKLPALTTISLKGACRVSDAGLTALVSSAPALRSLNLSDCSLLTDVGIESVANSLGAILQELYLENCNNLDTKRILPMFKRMKSLEVLSLEGMVSVSDKFIKEFVSTNGQNMKELNLAGCVKLTNSSLKVIGETCSQLRALDLSHLGKLTDTGMAHLTNGCRGLQNLKLRRCSFSDDAVAVFLEASGNILKELSLNYVSKVSQNTTISLARRCTNLEILDLSWCRRLTDEALGLIADSCLSLRLLKIFGCTQVSNIFVNGHSNPHLDIVGLKLTPILEHINRPEFQQSC